MPWIKANWSGKCAECGDKIIEGDNIFYLAKTTYCAECGKEAEENAE